MTAKEYLQRPKQIVQEIRRKQGRIETLKRLATRLGPEMSGIRVQTTRTRPGSRASWPRPRTRNGRSPGWKKNCRKPCATAPG